VLHLLALARRLLNAPRRHLLGALWRWWLRWLGRAGLLLRALWGLFLVWLTTLVGRLRGRGLRDLIGSIELLRPGGTAAPWPGQKRRRRCTREHHLPL